MPLPDKFPLDFAGIEPKPPVTTSKIREQQELADLVATVIAIENTRPIRPRGDTLGKIHSAISRKQPLALTQCLLILSGWAAAAAVLLFTLLKPDTLIPNVSTKNIVTQAPKTEKLAQPSPSPQETPAPLATSRKEIASFPTQQIIPAAAPLTDNHHHQLTKEIEVLREQVKILAGRDKEHLVVQSGISWPIIMKLTKPGSDPTAAIIHDSILSSLLDAQKTQAQIPEPEVTQDAKAALLGGVSEDSVSGSPALLATPQEDQPSILLTYDPARRVGILDTENFEEPEPGTTQNLWATSTDSSEPVLVGSIPAGISRNDQFTFTIDARVIPQSFVITQDPTNAPSAPNASNTAFTSPVNPGQ